jgi:hypothetical protein
MNGLRRNDDAMKTDAGIIKKKQDSRIKEQGRNLERLSCALSLVLSILYLVTCALFLTFKSLRKQ